MDDRVGARLRATADVLLVAALLAGAPAAPAADEPVASAGQSSIINERRASGAVPTQAPQPGDLRNAPEHSDKRARDQVDQLPRVTHAPDRAPKPELPVSLSQEPTSSAGSADALRAEASGSPSEPKDPRLAEADRLARKGIAALRRGDFAAAESALGRAASLAPERRTDWQPALTSARFWGLIRSADEAQEAGNLELAETRLRAAQALDPEDAEARLQLGRITVRLHRSRAERALAAGDLSAAVASAERAYSMDPGDPWNSLLLARALIATDAESQRERIVALLGADHGTAVAAGADVDAYAVALGFAWLELDARAEAAAAFARVPEDSPSREQAEAGLGIVCMRNGDYAAAVEHLQRAPRNHPEYLDLLAEARLHAGLAQFDRALAGGDIGAARKRLAALEAAGPTRAEVLYAGARLAEAGQHWEDAVHAYGALLEQDARDVTARAGYVVALERLGRYAQADAAARPLDESARERLPLFSDRKKQEGPRFAAALRPRHRSGEEGLGALDDEQLEAAFTIPLRPGRPLRIGVRGIALDAGRPGHGALLGLIPALGDTAAGKQAERGVEIAADVAAGDDVLVRVSSGVLGAPLRSGAGALHWRGRWPDVELRATLERRPVTDSLLSYVGAREPHSGETWGGVTQDRLALNAGHAFSPRHGVYGSLAFGRLHGRHVVANHARELGAGYYRALRSSATVRLTAGFNLTALRYERNLSHFTFGHGGYFSPQRFLALGPYFDWSGRRADWSYRLRGSAPWQRIREDAARYFPLDPTQQAMAGNPVHPGSDRREIGMNVALNLERRIGRASAGVEARLISSGAYDEYRFQVYVRRWTGKVVDPVYTPPRTVIDRDFSIDPWPQDADST